MRISRIATAAGIVLAAFAAGANADGTIGANTVTFTKVGPDVVTTGVPTGPTVYNLGTASETAFASWGAVGSDVGTDAPVFKTAGPWGDTDSLQLAFTADTHQTLFGVDGPVLFWDGTKFEATTGIYADGLMSNASGGNEATTKMTTNSNSLDSPIYSGTAFGDSVGYGPAVPSTLGGTGFGFQLFLGTGESNGYASPADGIYLILMEATLVDDASTPFGLLVGIDTTDTPLDFTAATAVADAEITPEPASFALLTIGSVLMLRRNRRVA